jgi:hypothetical protein
VESSIKKKQKMKNKQGHESERELLGRWKWKEKGERR